MAPWKSLYKATSAVREEGAVIRLLPGTYLETRQSLLPVGVSIEGSGPDKTILKSTLTADWTAMILARSEDEGTLGNQFISHLKMDGQSLSTFWAIQVVGRGNFQIHHTTIVDFKDRGVLFLGRTDNTDRAPTRYAQNNQFYANTVLNSSAYNTANGIYGRCNLCIGGQEGMLVYENTLVQDQRPDGYNGNVIKFELNGHNRNLKIYKNIIRKKPFKGSSYGDAGWPFAIELWHSEGGLEIYDNVITGGGIDLDGISNPLQMPFGASVRNNSIVNETQNDSHEVGIFLENNVADVIIEKNLIDRKTTGIMFTPRYGDTIRNIKIRNNLMTNIGRMANGNDGAGITVCSDYTRSTTIEDVFIQNNTIVAGLGIAPWFGVMIQSEGTKLIDGFILQNNSIQGFVASAFRNADSAYANQVIVQNNNFYQNGNSNEPEMGSPLNSIVSGNLKLNPTFVGDGNFTLQGGSPLIDRGINIGVPFSGPAPDIGYAERQ